MKSLMLTPKKNKKQRLPRKIVLEADRENNEILPRDGVATPNVNAN